VLQDDLFTLAEDIESDHDFEQVNSCNEDYLHMNIEDGEDEGFDSL
jgi:hypothetical protein